MPFYDDAATLLLKISKPAKQIEFRAHAIRCCVQAKFLNDFSRARVRVWPRAFPRATPSHYRD